MIKINSQEILELFNTLELWNNFSATLNIPKNTQLEIDGLIINSNDLIGGKFLGRRVDNQDFFVTGIL